ncbi:hypothetical protein CYLTODRAFT_415638 [Cylindrobasidium torrendii FP15055 ss-10]|uniref:F-box domain-containing protein n=1 Tax=Cylindrobasidium torrendii FP15055 ss-10 TaxID=1314674 RepID=A0A0D7ATI4_9AGAR|nr:hypothetical protein CYLTODRAFT_415638 [Cylindrobasidium torrendii FP15055 ss-10]
MPQSDETEAYEGAYLISPLVENLPFDILAAIFRKTLESHNDDFDERESTFGHKAILPIAHAMSHVSRSWRMAALSAGFLWCEIEVNSQTIHDHLSVCLTRAGGSQLDVAIHCPEVGDLDQKNVEAVFARVQKWRTCKIFMVTESLAQPIAMRLCGANAPHLRYLSLELLRSENLSRANVNTPILDGKVGAPLLSFMRLRGYAFRYFVPPSLAVSTLHLELTTFCVLFNFSAFKSFVENFPMLQHLSLWGDMLGEPDKLWPFPPMKDGIPGTLIDLPKLRSLRLYSHSGSIYSGLLQVLNAPDLTTLNLRGMAMHDLNPLARICPHRYTSVKSILLTDIDFPIHNAYETLRTVFPCLGKLGVLGQDYQVPVLLNFLSGKFTDGWLPWEDLHTLTISLDVQKCELLQETMKVRQKREHPVRQLYVVSVQEAVDDYMENEWELEEPAFDVLYGFDEIWPPGRTVEDFDNWLFL